MRDPCGSHVCYYQKDGPGILKRMYWDRIIGLELTHGSLKCSECDRLIGVEITFHKESRTAHRLFAGTVKKKVAKISELPQDI